MGGSIFHRRAVAAEQRQRAVQHDWLLGDALGLGGELGLWRGERRVRTGMSMCMCMCMRMRMRMCMCMCACGMC